MSGPDWDLARVAILPLANRPIVIVRSAPHSAKVAIPSSPSVYVAMTTYLPSSFTDASNWDSAMYAFLAEKERRSGSQRTVQAYATILRQFFGQAGTTPDEITSQHVFSFAHGNGLSGRTPSASTVGARLACVSSFYRFLIRFGMVTSNPCDALERPKTQPSTPRGLSAEEVQKLLAAIPDTVPGRRDRAIVLTLILTARRKTEVLSLSAGDLSIDGGKVYYRYRGKGGKSGRRELPRPAYDAIVRTLDDAGKSLADLQPSESLWQAGSPQGAISHSNFYTRLRRYFRDAGINASGIHVLRHTGAKLRRDAGESIESVSSFLDHSSLAVTSVYLKRLEGQEDRGWEKVAVAIGV